MDSLYSFDDIAPKSSSPSQSSAKTSSTTKTEIFKPIKDALQINEFLIKSKIL